jgi:hypothetical protein
MYAPKLGIFVVLSSTGLNGVSNCARTSALPRRCIAIDEVSVHAERRVVDGRRREAAERAANGVGRGAIAWVEGCVVESELVREVLYEVVMR